MVEKTVARLLIVACSCRRDINLGRSFAGRQGRRRAPTYGVLYLISPINTIFSLRLHYLQRNRSLDRRNSPLSAQTASGKQNGLFISHFGIFLPRRRFRRKFATAGVVFSSKKQPPRPPQAPIYTQKKNLSLCAKREVLISPPSRVPEEMEPCTSRAALYAQLYCSQRLAARRDKSTVRA